MLCIQKDNHAGRVPIKMERIFASEIKREASETLKIKGNNDCHSVLPGTPLPFCMIQ